MPTQDEVARERSAQSVAQLELFKQMEETVRVHSFIYCCKCMDCIRIEGGSRMKVVQRAFANGYEFRDCQWFCPTHKKGQVYQRNPLNEVCTEEGGD